MSESRDSWADRLNAMPQRTFGNPYAAWHYRELDRSMYFTDVDGVEAVGTYPVILYEVKTIRQSLYRDIIANRDHDSHEVVTDFLGRINFWQIQTLRRMLKPGLQEGYLVITPSSCEAFWSMTFDAVVAQFDPHSPTVWGRTLAERNGTRGYRAIRKNLLQPCYWKNFLSEKRHELAGQWKFAEQNGLL